VPAEDTGAISLATTFTETGAHLMLTEQARAASPPLEIANAGVLTYFGGPVIQNVEIIPVYWTSATAFQSNMNAFYAAVSTGPYMAFLSQYSTSSPPQKIGNGGMGKPFVDNSSLTNVTDAQIQTELVRLFNRGLVPEPTDNSYYPVHFPAGVTITGPGGEVSCVVFCAYHGTFQVTYATGKVQNVYYGVVPDLSTGGCAAGCGTSTIANNTTSVSSHEFAETITDPAVGLATTFAPPLSWYNPSQGEIGDICNGQETNAVLGDGKTYTVQMLASNAAGGACVTP
jgi:hypothetical protein